MDPRIEQVKTWQANAVEQLHDKLYDRYTLSSTLAKIALFNSPVSATRQGAQLTVADTNVRSVAIPSNEDWVLHGIGVHYEAIAPRTTAQVQFILDYFRQLYFFMKIGGKDLMFELTMDQLFGPLNMVHQPAATQNDRLPLPLYTGYWKFEVPIPVQHLTTWELTVECVTVSNVALDGDKIRFVFDREKLRNS